MKFKKLVKAEEYNAEKENKMFDLEHKLKEAIEKCAGIYVKNYGLNKEQIMQALNTCVFRFEEDTDMWADWGL